MNTTGKLISGMRSTRRRLYEKMPSTRSAAMIMVAKTGWLMLVRVIHMASARLRRPGDGRLHHRRNARLQAAHARAHHVQALLEPALHFDQALLRLGHADLHRALRDLAAL